MQEHSNSELLDGGIMAFMEIKYYQKTVNKEGRNDLSSRKKSTHGVFEKANTSEKAVARAVQECSQH